MKFNKENCFIFLSGIILLSSCVLATGLYSINMYNSLTGELYRPISLGYILSFIIIVFGVILMLERKSKL
ncbi:hypothetical protein [Petrocella sp. FN5]|uniref:hypothetical protein n=1 Tax=Petrocella sp. FN5 TaxID=3032002 RepID=UPI0023DA583C|nr:hypothetical protein [Petrocella sp. FN5]MDF1616745.1 hypothetical protein [Petrocella sp. FN5]